MRASLMLLLCSMSFLAHAREVTDYESVVADEYYVFILPERISEVEAAGALREQGAKVLAKSLTSGVGKPGVRIRAERSVAVWANEQPWVEEVTGHQLGVLAATEAAPTTGDNQVIQLERSASRANLPRRAYEYAYTGAGVDLYIVDDAVATTHPEFGNRATQVIFSGGPIPFDESGGHGTFVASLAAGVQAGFAKEATVFAYDVVTPAIANPPWGIQSGHLVDALRDIRARILTRPGRAAIINLSLNFPAIDTAVNGAVSSLLAATDSSGQLLPITVVVAAGNDTVDANTTSPSSADPALVVVGNVNQSDQWVGDSNFGPALDVLACGEGLVAALSAGGFGRSGSGTSASAAVVSGAAAIAAEATGLRRNLGTLLVGQLTYGAALGVPLQTSQGILYVGFLGPRSLITARSTDVFEPASASEALQASFVAGNHSWNAGSLVIGGSVPELACPAGAEGTAPAFRVAGADGAFGPPIRVQWAATNPSYCSTRSSIAAVYVEQLAGSTQGDIYVIIQVRGVWPAYLNEVSFGKVARLAPSGVARTNYLGQNIEYVFPATAFGFQGVGLVRTTQFGAGLWAVANIKSNPYLQFGRDIATVNVSLTSLSPVAMKVVGDLWRDEYALATVGLAGDLVLAGATNGTSQWSFCDNTPSCGLPVPVPWRDPFGQVSPPPLGGLDAFVLRRGGQFDQIGVTVFGTSANDQATALHLSGTQLWIGGETGGSLVAGSAQGGIDVFAVPLLVSPTTSDLRADQPPASSFLSGQYGSGADDHLRCLWATARGSVYLGGYTSGSWAGPSQGEDAFVAKLEYRTTQTNPVLGGARLWAWQSMVGGDERFLGCAMTAPEPGPVHARSPLVLYSSSSATTWPAPATGRLGLVRLEDN